MSKHSSHGSAWEKTRQRILIRDGWQCVICGKYLKNETAHVDHVVPKAKGGTDDDWNLRTLCPKHNLEKGDRLITRETWFNPNWLDRLPS